MVYRSPNRRHERQFFYKYVNIQVAKIILSSCRLRWSSPVLFNDPFDIPREYTAQLDPNELENKLTEEIVHIILEGRPTHLHELLEIKKLLRADKSKLSRDSIISSYAGVPKIFDANRAIDLLRQSWDKILHTFRIICLSEVNDSMPMWAHYSNDHTGAALQFECLDKLDSPLLVAQPMIYSDEPPSIPTVEKLVKWLTGQKDYDWKDAFNRCQYKKGLEWSYEKEWRVVSSARPGETGEYSDWPFSPKELTNIFFGLKTTEEDISEIKPFIADELIHVGMHKARIEPGKQSLAFYPIK